MRSSVGYTDQLQASGVVQGTPRESPSQMQFFLNNYRGMAQLAARVVWDHEAGSSSLPTPTSKDRHSNLYVG